jgi:hypothetical protein
MPARVKKIRHDENTRAKIQASQIINRLQSYVNGKCQMEPAQVSAGLGLLRKVLPDLQSTALTDKNGGPLQIVVQRFADGAE